MPRQSNGKTSSKTRQGVAIPELVVRLKPNGLVEVKVIAKGFEETRLISPKIANSLSLGSVLSWLPEGIG